MACGIARASLVAALATSTALSGCAVNPLVRMENAAASKGTMADSVEYANALKRLYKDKAYSLAGTQALVDNAILGLGVATLGLIVFKANPDAYRATALAGGSLYLSGKTNVSSTRFGVYQSGIGAIDCAVAAASPMRFGPTELEDIGKDAARLDDLVVGLDGAEANVRSKAAAAPLDASAAALVKRAVDGTAPIRAAALRVVGEAGSLESRATQVALQLRTTIDAIDHAVEPELYKTVPDPTAVQQSLGSLVTLAGRAAPFPGVGEALGSRLSAQSGTFKSTDGTPRSVVPSLTEALSALAAAQARVEIRTTALSSRLAVHATDPSTLVKACGTIDFRNALALDATVIELKPRDDEAVGTTVTVTGGVKNYTARIKESPTGGVEVKSPVAGDSTIEVKVAKGAKPIVLTLQVQDSSSPPQMQSARIEVGGGNARTSTTESASAPANDATGNPLLDALQNFKAKVGTFDTKSGNRYTVANVVATGDDVRVTVTCKQKDAKSVDNVTVLANALLSTAKTKGVVSEVSASDEQHVRFDGAAPCAK